MARALLFAALAFTPNPTFSVRNSNREVLRISERNTRFEFFGRCGANKTDAGTLLVTCPDETRI